MKKVALSLIALLAAGSFAFAEDVAVEKNAAVAATLSADASATWGVDLDTKVHGFNNGANFDLTLTFVPEGDSSKTGAGDVHGYIFIDNVSIEVDNEDGTGDDDNDLLSLGDITAKIVAGDLYVKLYTNSDAVADFKADDDDDSIYVVGEPKKYSGKYGGDAEWTLAQTGSTTAYTLFAGKGIEAGYTIPGTASVTAVLDSAKDWSVDSQSSYEGSIAVSLLAVEKLTLTGKYLTGKLAGEIVSAAGGEFAYDLGVATPFAHVNLDLTNDAYDSDFGALLALVDGLKASAVVQYDSESVANVIFSADLAADKLAGPLSAVAGLRLTDVTDEAGNGAGTEIFGKVGFKASDVLSLSGSLSTYSDNDSDSSMFLKAGVDFTGISLTTLSVNWDSSDLGAAESTGDSKLGKLTFTGKVAY